MKAFEINQTKQRPLAYRRYFNLPRFWLLLLMMTSLQSFADGLTQNRVSISAKQANFKKVINSIEKQTSFRFLYNQDIVNKAGKVSIEAKNELLQKVLDDLLEGTGIQYKLLEDDLVVFSANDQVFEATPDIRVSGKVSDSSGTGLAGVSVTVKGTSLGTSTDLNGNFALTAPDDATLVFSSVGFQIAEIAVSGRTDLQVALMPAVVQALDEVVVVGYGTQRKKDLTGSVSSVKGAELAKQPVLTATQALQGKVAGVQVITSGAPNALPTVRVRGTGTTLGGAEPLYVVDGVITNDIRNINSADIVTLDVLKDASATAIYGMRAANGVMLITTKKGRSGKMVIGYDANVGIREATNLVDMAGPNQYANYLNEASVYYGSGDSLVPASRLASGTHTDWFDAILRTGVQHNHNISLSGGSDKIIYFLSASYLSDEGILETNHFKRITVRSNNEYRLSSKLKLNTMVSFSNSNLRDANLGNFNNAYRAAPYVAAKIGDKYGNTSEAGNVGNPILSLDKNHIQSVGNRVQGTFSLDYKPVNALTLRTSLGTDLEFFRSSSYGYQFFSDLNTFLTPGGNQAQGRSSLNVGNNNAYRYVWDNTATYAKTFGDHNVTVLAGVTAEEYKFNGMSGSRFDVPPSRDQWYLNAGSTDGLNNSNSGDKFTRNSYLARVNYGYDSRYMITATMRADGTSRFSSENRWGYFPSVAAAWNISNEGFMDNQKVFNNLKLRIGYGKVGNDQIPTSLYYTLAAINVPYVFDNARILGISFNNLTDKNVRWEVTNETNIGLDFGLLNNRLTGELDLYNKQTKDALVFVNIPAILGDADNRYITNAADIENKGIEISLNWRENFGRKWGYSLGANAGFNKNQIVGLNGGQALFDGGIGGQGNTTKTDNGQPIGSFFILTNTGIIQTAEEAANAGYAGARIGDLKYKDLNGDKVINDLDREYQGSYIPKITFGFNGGFNYEAFDFAFNAYGTQGSMIYNGKKATRGSDPRDNIEANEARNRWTPNNPNTSIPRANTAQLRASTYFLEKGDFLRMNNMTLGYTVPAGTLGKLKMSTLRLYITSQNLFTITGYSGFTPELQSGSPLNGGIELNSYPTTRTFAFGVNLAF